jgi:sec-independent protein translocase protein TatA
MFRPEPLDLVLIALAAMLIFGANRLPEVARAMGKAIRGFKDGLAGKEENDKPKVNQ